MFYIYIFKVTVMKNFFAIISLVLGVVGLGVFFNPILEIICGIGGLIFAILAKNKDAGMVMNGIRYWGRNIAWLNIFWVCVEVVLMFVGISLF